MAHAEYRGVGHLFKCYFHAVTADARNALNDAVLNEYGRAFAQAQSESEDEDFEEIEDESEGLSPKM